MEVTQELEDRITGFYNTALEANPKLVSGPSVTYRSGYLQGMMESENALHWYAELVETKRELNKLKEEYNSAKKRYEYYDTRFVEVCKNCDEKEKEDCVLRIINPDACKNCGELIDMENLIDKAFNINDACTNCHNSYCLHANAGHSECLARDKFISKEEE